MFDPLEREGRRGGRNIKHLYCCTPNIVEGNYWVKEPRVERHKTGG
jgi:DUF1680 family protein